MHNIIIGSLLFPDTKNKIVPVTGRFCRILSSFWFFFFKEKEQVIYYLIYYILYNLLLGVIRSSLTAG